MQRKRDSNGACFGKCDMTGRVLMELKTRAFAGCDGPADRPARLRL